MGKSFECDFGTFRASIYLTINPKYSEIWTPWLRINGESKKFLNPWNLPRLSNLMYFTAETFEKKRNQNSEWVKHININRKKLFENISVHKSIH